MEKAADPRTTIIGTKVNGKMHVFVIGNEVSISVDATYMYTLLSVSTRVQDGEVLPRFLNCKIRLLESGTAWGKAITIKVVNALFLYTNFTILQAKK